MSDLFNGWPEDGEPERNPEDDLWGRDEDGTLYAEITKDELDKIVQRLAKKQNEIERLRAIADLAFAYRNASFSDQEDIGLELDTALEGDDG